MAYGVKINGRHYFVGSEVCAVRKVSAGRFEVTYDRTTFLVIGGRASGGGSREWFVQNKLFFGEQLIPCNSMIAAIRKGIQS